MDIMYLVYYYTIGKPMEQDLLKAFGVAYVMHFLPSSPNWAAQVLVVKYFISPHFAEFTKDVVWHQETLKPTLHKTEQICGRVAL
ncbi:hypothetical protein CY35_12G018300 [Sphagnum magellanicum]|nr:hypothetical protein CY35_12G018300 [Sphagnum magellanicum]